MKALDTNVKQYRLFDTTTRWQRLSLLVELGGYALDEFNERGVLPKFQPWFVSVKEMAAMKQVNFDHSDAEWLWDVLRSESSVQRELGSLPPAGVSWFKQTEHFHLLPKGARFAIGLSPYEVRNLLQTPSETAPDARIVVRLLEKLRMRPGKASRLECCNVLGELTIKAEETFGSDREAEIMRVEPQLITLGEKTVTVITKSLNQAYSVASRRLEPNRRQHGGHTYDRLVYLGSCERIKLEHIRRRVETDDWEVPADMLDG